MIAVDTNLLVYAHHRDAPFQGEAASAVRSLGESTNYLPNLSDAIRTARATGGAVHDARIAALCRYHGVRVLWIADRDVSRYPELRLENPLVPQQPDPSSAA